MYPILKRMLDVAVAAFLLILLAPVLGITALLVWWGLGAPVLFRQERAGHHGRPFCILKFRTMIDALGPDGKDCPDEVRLTRLGRFLRSTSLDELTQLFNILKGDLSLVGPRPLYLKYVPRYNEDQKRRLSVPQGLTGLAQIKGRNALSWDEKFQWDLTYVETASFWVDLTILFRTLQYVLARKGITQEGCATMPEFLGREGDSHA